MPGVIVGFDGSEQARDALALGRLLAEASGAELVAAFVYGSMGAVAHPDLGVWQEDLRREAEQTLASGAEAASPRAVESDSAARGLHDLAEAEGADMLVLGPSHRGGVGRVLLGSVAERLLHGSPCPVAVAPRGYAEAEHRLATLGVGYDGGPEAEAALAGGVELAQRTGATLQVLGIALSTESPYEGGFEAVPGVAEAREKHLEEVVQTAVDSVPDDVQVTGEVIAGGIEALGREPGVDLLVVGSRGYGPARRVLLGSTAASLIHHAAYPVLVYPRGAA